MNSQVRRIAITVALGAFALAASAVGAKGPDAAKPPRDYPVEPVPFTAVHFTDAFWLPRIETNRKVTIPFTRTSTRCSRAPPTRSA
jgi:hypothetical protein